jgi:RecA-family ATPase
MTARHEISDAVLDKAMQALNNTKLDNIAIQQDARKAGIFPFEPIESFQAGPARKPWLIKGVIAKGETSAWIAPPGGMKSALMVDLAMCVSFGTDEWHGWKRKGLVAVVYFALERADLVKRRLRAMHTKLGITDENPVPIAVVSSTIDLMNPDSVGKVVKTIRAVEDHYGETVGLLIFDTFAKAIAAGGGDEDKARDQGKVFANIQRVKDQVGAHIALVGHTGKDETRGARGSNAILGDVDLMVTIGGDTIRTATITKANDAPEGRLFSFKAEMFDFGVDEDGDPITVNIVSDEIVDTPTASPREPKLTANQKTMFAMLHAAGRNGLPMEDWNTEAREAGIGVKRKADLTDIRNALLAKGLVSQYGDRWVVRHVD